MTDKHTMPDVRKGVIQGTEIEVKYVSWETYAALEQNMASMEETNRALIKKCQRCLAELERVKQSHAELARVAQACIYLLNEIGINKANNGQEAIDIIKTAIANAEKVVGNDN